MGMLEEEYSNTENIATNTILAHHPKWCIASFNII